MDFMNSINKIKEIGKIASDKDVQEKLTSILEDAIGTISGDPLSAAKLLKDVINFPFFIQQRAFWNKFSKFLTGVFLTEEDCAKMSAKFAKDGNKDENAMRLIACIDRADSMQKIDFLINATRCLLADFIDLEKFFRICMAVSNTLFEDLIYLKKHITTDERLPYNKNVQGLYTAGIMYIINFEETPEFSFTPLADDVDKFAVSYNDVGRYPNPVKQTSEREVKLDSLPFKVEYID